VTKKLTSEDFLTGLLAELAHRNWKTISIRGDRFDRASAAAYDCLQKIAEDNDLDLRFQVLPDPRYGDSGTLRDAVARLAQWDLVSLDNPEYQDIRLKISRSFADTLFEQLKLDREVYRKVADQFESAYYGATAPH
jgi:hypothetical protein